MIGNLAPPLKGGSPLRQNQLPLSRPEGHHLRLHIDRACSIRIPHNPHPLSESSASTFAGSVRFDLFANFRQPRLRPSAR